ncbi:DNA-directed RNA polymerase M/15kDa subunit [Penicillium vulpinum]|uniref:DNA-directed RNA polymerase M/15kDa subunit n=1 Tax=Penicillium vulpinum TaxID=29845 RepID=UPI002546B40D|nr:DNA-directed RNA polymerase M/15kDa subunit [Penicillium vulpinum]KAJ5964777.1 DNA-directed RNA polymerase M/15kDa subunit [Penicillium vulpinum]
MNKKFTFFNIQATISIPAIFWNLHIRLARATTAYLEFRNASLQHVCQPFFHGRWWRQQAIGSNSLQILPSNLLYPKEDRVNNQLMFTCRTCHVGEPASSHCVYQNHLHSQVGDTAGVTQDVTSDPTVCLPGFCTLCGDIITCSICGPNPNEYLLEDAPPVGDSLEISEDEPQACASAHCGETEAVFFQSQQRSAETGMKLYYVCCACGQVYM